MADINIEKRTSPNWLWWVLGAVILAFLVIWLLTGVGGDRVAVDDPAVTPVTEPMPAPMTPDPVTRPAAVDQYMATCVERAPDAMGLGHTHTAQCLRQLADAVAAAAPQDAAGAVQADLQQARTSAQELEASAAEALNHSQMARDGMTAIASAMQTLQAQRFPQLAQPIGDLNTTATQVNPGVPLLDQRTEVQRFFEQAGQVLQRMTTTV